MCFARLLTSRCSCLGRMHRRNHQLLSVASGREESSKRHFRHLFLSNMTALAEGGAINKRPARACRLLKTSHLIAQCLTRATNFHAVAVGHIVPGSPTNLVCLARKYQDQTRHMQYSGMKSSASGTSGQNQARKVELKHRTHPVTAMRRSAAVRQEKEHSPPDMRHKA